MKPEPRAKRRGNCYVVAEALYHLTGGKKGKWTPYRLRHEGDTHWYLVALLTPDVAPVFMPIRVILDPTVKQFKSPPDYSRGRGAGFLTRRPSRRARELMDQLLWQPASPDQLAPASLGQLAREQKTRRRRSRR